MTTQGWTNLRKLEDQERQLNRSYHEAGYSHGYGLTPAKSTHAEYMRGYLAGRRARVAFDAGDAA